MGEHKKLKSRHWRLADGGSPCQKASRVYQLVTDPDAVTCRVCCAWLHRVGQYRTRDILREHPLVDRCKHCGREVHTATKVPGVHDVCARRQAMIDAQLRELAANPQALRGEERA